MTKRVQAKTKDNQFIWMISPDIAVKPLGKRSKLTFLDVFHFFAQSLISVDPSKKLAKEEEKQIIAARKKILIELNNKVVQLKFFANELKKQEKQLILSKDNSKKKIYNYKPYQKFIGLVEAYLNTVHSLHYWLKSIDEALGKKFSKKIWSEPWFRLDTDLRNLFQHIESPLALVEDNKVHLIFERIDELDEPKYFTEEKRNEIRNPQGRYKVTVECHDMGDDLLLFLDKWAKKYIDLVDEKETVNAITGFHKDGRTKSKNVSLKELKEKVSTSANKV